MPALDDARTYEERGHEAWALLLLGQITVPDGSPDVATAAAHDGQAWCRRSRSPA